MRSADPSGSTGPFPLGLATNSWAAREPSASPSRDQPAGIEASIGVAVGSAIVLMAPCVSRIHSLGAGESFPAAPSGFEGPGPGAGLGFGFGGGLGFGFGGWLGFGLGGAGSGPSVLGAGDGRVELVP